MGQNTTDNGNLSGLKNQSCKRGAGHPVGAWGATDKLTLFRAPPGPRSELGELVDGKVSNPVGRRGQAGMADAPKLLIAATQRIGRKGEVTPNPRERWARRGGRMEDQGWSATRLRQVPLGESARPANGAKRSFFSPDKASAFGCQRAGHSWVGRHSYQMRTGRAGMQEARETTSLVD